MKIFSTGQPNDSFNIIQDIFLQSPADILHLNQTAVDDFQITGGKTNRLGLKSIVLFGQKNIHPFGKMGQPRCTGRIKEKTFKNSIPLQGQNILFHGRQGIRPLQVTVGSNDPGKDFL